MESCYIFDIDGTLSDASHRLHYIKKPEWLAVEEFKPNWDAFFEECDKDAPIVHMIELLNNLWWFGKCAVVIVTGRSDKYQDKTEQWLYNHDVVHDAIYMRADGDFRQDYIIKSELLDELKSDGYEPTMAFEDRTQVVEMWRERGIPCAQVAPGDY